MTVRLPRESRRVTNWLAGWLDYVLATVLTAGRWLRVPTLRSEGEPVMLAAFAPSAMRDSYSAAWRDEDDDGPGSGALVRVLEIVMLSISFFLAAHLLSGGTPTVSAPNLNSFGLGDARIQAASLPVPANTGKQVVVPAGSFVHPDWAAPPAVQSFEATEEAVTAPAQEEIAVLAPPDGAGADAASIAPIATPAPQPAAVEEAAPPAPAPIVEPPAAEVIPVFEDKYLTIDEFRAAALAAGWVEGQFAELEVVAFCESRYHTHATYLGALGLMQMMPNWFESAGLKKQHWADPVVNLTAAKYAYDYHLRVTGDGWGPWTCKP